MNWRILSWHTALAWKVYAWYCSNCQNNVWASDFCMWNRKMPLQNWATFCICYIESSCSGGSFFFFLQTHEHVSTLSSPFFLFSEVRSWLQTWISLHPSIKLCLYEDCKVSVLTYCKLYLFKDCKVSVLTDCRLWCKTSNSTLVSIYTLLAEWVQLHQEPGSIVFLHTRVCINSGLHSRSCVLETVANVWGRGLLFVFGSLM